jgi:hypothetical protein
MVVAISYSLIANMATFLFASKSIFWHLIALLFPKKYLLQ